MSRSERFYARARRLAWWALLVLGVCVCAAVWSVRLYLDFPGPGGLGFGVSLAGLCLFFALAGECARLLRLAERERHWEQERARRPRL